MTSILGNDIIRSRQAHLARLGGGISMDKEQILKLSRQEHEYKHDEYEAAAIHLSYKISRIIGGALCALLAILGAYIFEDKELSMGVCAVYYSMATTGNIIRFVKMRKKQDLFWGIIDSLVTIACLVLLFIWLV